MSETERELVEYRRQRVALRDLIARKRLSRRMTFKGAALLTIAGGGGLSSFLAACSSGKKTSGGGSGSAGESGFNDTTGVAAYTLGVPDAKIDPKWQQYPYVYKYNWRRYNWDAPLATGGHAITSTGPPANWDLMKSAWGPFASLYLQGLWHSGIHAGLNLDSSSIEPDLAEKTEHNSDYTTWTFTIPKGVKFHNIAPVNGREVTAEDVAFSFQRYIDTSIWNKPLQFVSKVSVPEANVVRFDMKQPQTAFDSIVAQPYFLIFAKEHFENQDQFKARPIGTGAFINESSVYQDKAEAVRNPEFYMNASWMNKNSSVRLPFLDRLTFQNYASDAPLRAALIAGQVDDYNIAYLDPAILKDVLSARSDFQVTVIPGWAVWPLSINWNYSNKLFQDVRIRRALSMAIDREELFRNVFSGAGIPGGGPVAFDLMGSDLPIPLSEYGPYWQYDPKQAASLMKEAGYENGLTLQFEVSSALQSQTYGIQFEAYKAVQQYWRQNLKVDVQFAFKDPLAVSQDQLGHAFPDLTAGGNVSGFDAYSLITPWVRTGGAINYGQVSDSQLDSLIDQLGTATSAQRVADLTKQTIDRIRDQVSQLWLGWPQAAIVTHSWVHGDCDNTYGTFGYLGMENFRSLWIDQNTPGGRGGKPV